MSGNQVTAPTRAEFRSLRECKTLGEAFSCPEFLDRIKQSAPAHVKPQRMLRTFVQATSRAPLLLKCNMRSVLGAMLTCTEVGLEPNTPLQHAFLIPFAKYKWNPGTRTRELVDHEVQLIFGYPGLLDLAYRSGHVVSVHADIAWQKDEFSFAYGTDSHLRHIPSGQHEGNEVPRWAYAHASLTNGQAFEVMPWADVLRIRNGSQGYQSALRAKEAGEKAPKPYIPASWTEAPWVKNEPAMGKKTAFRSLSKWIPKSVELAGALALDEQQDASMVDFGAVLDGNASIIEGGFTETEPSIEGDAPDPTAMFTDRRPDADPPKQVDQTPPAETRSTTRKAPAKRASPPPIDDEIPTGRWEDEAAQSTATADPPQMRVADQLPGHLVDTTGVRADRAPIFRQYLVDGEGDPIPDGDGVIEEFTDPVAFAHAFKEAEANEFPGTVELFRRANHDALALAMAASTEVSGILAPKQPAPVQQAAQTARTDNPTLPMDMPVDPWVVAAPTSKAKAEMTRYLDELKAVAAKVRTPEEYNHVRDVNAPIYETFLDARRLQAMGIMDSRLKEMAPAPTRDAAGPTMKDLAEGLLHDIYSLTAPESVPTWLAMDTTKAALAKLDPEWHAKVTKGAEARQHELTTAHARALADQMLARFRACKTAEDVVAIGNDLTFIADGKQLHAMVPTLWGEVANAGKARKTELMEAPHG